MTIRPRSSPMSSAAADITHVSNEVPFLDGCVVDPTENNLILCSDTDYWAALAAMGTDIVGLSGNHVNDFGRDGARHSLQWYRDHEIPIYGSGMNVDEACAPLMWEHNGNTFAFIAALAFDPPGAWAPPTSRAPATTTTTRSASCRWSASWPRRSTSSRSSCSTRRPTSRIPIPMQVAEFRELREAGADIVTGVQSHVPQAQEPYGAAGCRRPRHDHLWAGQPVL